MAQAELKSFEIIDQHFKQRKTLKITEIVSYKMEAAPPDRIFTRLTHESDCSWDEHVIRIRPGLHR